MDPIRINLAVPLPLLGMLLQVDLSFACVPGIVDAVRIIARR
jgi:uncharacterized membrane protein YqaE (UPF0057 family)